MRKLARWAIFLLFAVALVGAGCGRRGRILAAGRRAPRAGLDLAQRWQGDGLRPGREVPDGHERKRPVEAGLKDLQECSRASTGVFRTRAAAARGLPGRLLDRQEPGDGGRVPEVLPGDGPGDADGARLGMEGRPPHGERDLGRCRGLCGVGGEAPADGGGVGESGAGDGWAESIRGATSGTRGSARTAPAPKQLDEHAAGGKLPGGSQPLWGAGHGGERVGMVCGLVRGELLSVCSGATIRRGQPRGSIGCFGAAPGGMSIPLISAVPTAPPRTPIISITLDRRFPLRVLALSEVEREDRGELSCAGVQGASPTGQRAKCGARRSGVG